MEAFGGDDEHFGHLALLLLAVGGGGVAAADAHLPLQAQLADHPLHGAADVLGQGAQGGDPEELQAVLRLGLVILRVLVDKLDEGAQEDRKGLARAGRGVHQAAAAAVDGVPCFLLEGEGAEALVFEPPGDDLISYGIF